MILSFVDWLFKFGIMSETLGNNIVLYLRYRAKFQNKKLKGVKVNEKKESE